MWKRCWKDLLNKREIAISEDSEPLQILATKSKTAKWMIEGLPDDKCSIENACIVERSHRWPLLIDPQMQASKWIKNKYEDDLDEVNPHQKKWKHKAKQAVKEGRILWVDSVGEQLPSPLEPLIQKSFTIKKEEKFVKIGKDQVK